MRYPRHTVSALAHRVRYSYAEYLALEATSNVKHEYLDGQIYGMAGGSPEHAALAAAVVGLLFPQLQQGRYRAFSADLRVRVETSGLTTHPDVTVVCGPRLPSAQDAQAVTNPRLLVEVSSPGTEQYDRGDKFEHYRQIPALQQYVIVSHRERLVSIWSRTDGDAWTETQAVDGDVVELPSIAARLDVRALYDAIVEPT
jgi:Uma2 family endonuclease